MSIGNDNNVPGSGGNILRLALPIVIHLGFGLLAILSVYFAQERLFMDASYYLFQVVNNGSFHIELQRFILVFGQIVPWIGVHLGLPLSAIIVLTSVGYVMYYYLIFLVCWLRYRLPISGIVLIMIQVLGVIHGYFTPVFELYLAAGILILYDTVFRLERPSWRKDLVLVVLQIIILLSHPMAIFLWALVVWRNVYSRPAFPWKLIIGMILLAGLIYLAKAPLIDSYESDKFNYLLGQLKDWDAYQPLFHFSYWIRLVQYLVTYYWEVLILLASSVIILWRRKAFRLLFAGLAVIIFVIVVNQVAYNGLLSGRYMEQVYFPMVVIAILLGLWSWGELNNLWKWSYLIVMVLLITARVGRIWNVSDQFQERNAQFHRLIEYARDQGGSKWLTTTENLSRSYNWGNWSIPVETLLISAMDGPDKTVNIALVDTTDNLKKEPPRDAFIFRLDEVYPVRSLNNKYFKLSAGPYAWLQDPREGVPSLKELQSSLKIKANPERFYRTNRLVQIPIEMAYNGSGALPVYYRNGLNLAYHWFSAEGGIYLWDGTRTPIEVDVSHTYRQPVEVYTPTEPGAYQLVVDFVLEDSGWGGSGGAHTIQIRR